MVQLALLARGPPQVPPWRAKEPGLAPPKVRFASDRGVLLPLTSVRVCGALGLKSARGANVSEPGLSAVLDPFPVMLTTPAPLTLRVAETALEVAGVKVRLTAQLALDASA